MAYIGLQPQTKTVATSTQTITGNGVDLEFSLNRAVSKAADILVFVGNTVQVPETDYTATDNTLLFSAGNTPANAAVISVNYKAGALTTTFVSANSYPVGTTVSPSIRSVDAPSTGVYFPTTTSLAVTVAGNTRLTVTDSPTASSTSTGAVRVAGGVGISQALYVGGLTRITDTTTSTTSTSGALVVSGGAGVTENLNVGGDLNVAGDFTVAGQFTTTGSDSLAVNDPFIFLANANPGDSLDSGFISSYNDGSSQRYTGFFRDITDGKYKLFDNLLPQPTTTVDTGNVSFRLADVVVGNITATTITGNFGNTQVITAVGNLTTLSVAGTSSLYNIVYIYANNASSSTTTGALQVSGGVGVVGNINAGNVNATTNLTATNLSGTLVTAAQTNITSLGNLSSLSASGTIQTTGIVYANSTTASTSTTTGALVVNGGIGASGNIHSANVTGSFGLWGTVRTAAQGSITSVGTLTSLAVSGAITVNSGNNATAIVNGGTAGVGNVGATGQGFNIVFARATSAQYADVAERYLADAAYAPGTVLHFGGSQEVSQCNVDHCVRVAGVVSTNPAYIMNDSLQGEHVVDVALLGRVPCQVQGPVSRGDMMVSAGNGRARAEANPKLGAVIGKALQDFVGDVGVIEVVVGRI